MGSQANSFLSTPAFERFRRAYTTNVITAFRGMNDYTVATADQTMVALSCMNVIVSGSGGLEKMRLPVLLSSQAPNVDILESFWDFQYYPGGAPTRQIVGAFRDSGPNPAQLYSYQWNMAGTTLNPTLIATGHNLAGPWDMVELNNILFMANGQIMQKWLGSGILENWGIAAPVGPPTTNFLIPAVLNRSGNVTTATFGTVADVAIGDVVNVSGSVDPTFNGNRTVTDMLNQTNYTWADPGPDMMGINATVTITSQYANYTVITANRSGGVATITITTSSGTTTAFGPDFSSPSGNGLYVILAGITDPTFDGTWLVQQMLGNGTVFIIPQPGLADTSAVTLAGTLSSALSSSLTGWAWAFAYRNSVTGHIGNMSTPTAYFTGQNRTFFVSTNGQTSTDAQVDSIVWYRTLDGGGLLFQDQITMLGAHGAGTSLIDFYLDSELDIIIQGSLINNPPPVGKYLVKYQGRAVVVVFPQTVVWSGYEQILNGGRPEESFPPNNAINLAIGAEEIAGIGAIQPGVVMWSNIGSMWMLRGALEDITQNTPVVWTDYLEELPWKLGDYAQNSVQATPYGLIWFSADKAVKLYPGHGQPSDIGEAIYPLLRTVTPGTEGVASSAWFNWIDRDWYALLVAVDGSVSKNLIIFFSLNQDTQQIDAFPCNIQADWISAITTPAGQRQLVISVEGNLYTLPSQSTTTNGINLAPTSTGGSLSAYWRGNYFGNDQPYLNKMYRQGTLIVDNPGGPLYTATIRYVNDRQWTLKNPLVVVQPNLPNEQIELNQRAMRCSIEIGFPDADMDLAVLSLSCSFIGTADRRP